MKSAPHAQSQIADAAAFADRFKVSRETLGRLSSYVAELERWQPTLNLVAPSTLPHVWHRHIADSAQLVALSPATARTWVDLGSGGGFPGLVAAILLAESNPSCRVALVESDTRKAAFLRTAARAAGVPVDIFAERAEAAATRTNLKGADVVSARALAPLERLFGWMHPFSGPQTVLLLPKGRDFKAELQAAEKEWTFDVELVPSMTDAEARIAVVRHLLSGSARRP